MRIEPNKIVGFIHKVFSIGPNAGWKEPTTPPCSENVALLKDINVKYLGLYQKYKNIRKIIKSMKRKHINRKFAWVFVTNMELDDFHKYLKLYKRRWNIETGFRVHDEATIKTKSVDVRVRFFLFLAAMLLYNEWKSLGMPMMIGFTLCKARESPREKNESPTCANVTS